jgi:ketosteroid isomerase-like protein
MRNIIASVIVVILLPCLIFGQAKPTAGQNVAQEITALENAWAEATVKHDVLWFERNIADGFVMTDEDGVMTDKPAILQWVKGKLNNYSSFSHENLKVKVYGDTAIATGIASIKGTFKGKDATGKYPWTDTFVKVGGKWQCVASHNSKLPSK